MRNNRNLRLGENKSKTKVERRTPFPTVIDDNPWVIQEGRTPAFVTIKDGQHIMRVPLGDSEADRRIRLHEQGHIAFTPLFESEDDVPKGVEWQTLNAVEDSRIAIRLGKVHPEYKEINESVEAVDANLREQFRGAFDRARDAVDNPKRITAMNPPMQPLDIARYIAASKGYQEEDFFRELAWQSNFGWATEIVDRLYEKHFGRGNPTWDDTVNYARDLEREVGQVVQDMAEFVDEAEEAGFDEGIQRYYKQYKGDAQWGKLTVERPPLTQRMPTGMKAKKRRATDQGSVPRNWHRMQTDQKVFSMRKLRRNDCGTILIDQSGSMSLSLDEMREIIARWPGVIIAGYSGARPNRGYLRILAQNGRMVADRELPAKHQLNIVDGPALDWLGKQKGPRVWISDGIVTGVNEERNEWLLRDAARKVNKYRITRVENVREILGDR